MILLSQQSQEHINIDFDLNEIELTPAECKATYPQIKAYVKQHTGLIVSSLNIAQIKRKYGLIERVNYYKPTDKTKHPNCTKEKEQAITDALKYFKMI